MPLGCEIFYEKAKNSSEYPYVVYELQETSFNYIDREDSILIINVWDKRDKTEVVESLSDEIKKIFLFANIPTDKILATFYLESKMAIPDEDEKIKRRELRIKIESY